MTVIEMLLLPDSVRSFDCATGAYSTKNVHMKKQQIVYGRHNQQMCAKEKEEEMCCLYCCHLSVHCANESSV